MLGLAQTTIANYEQGKRFPDEQTLLKIADFFNVSMDYLFGRSEIKSCNEDFSLRDSMQLSKRFINPAILALKNSYFEALINGNLQIASELILNAVASDLIDIKILYSDGIRKVSYRNRTTVGSEYYRCLSRTLFFIFYTVNNVTALSLFSYF